MRQINKEILLQDFFDTPRKIITSEKALEDVIPINWEEILKTRKDNENQVIKFIKKN